MHVKLPPLNHFQSKIKYKFVLYEENTGHMHQIAPLTLKLPEKLQLYGLYVYYVVHICDFGRLRVNIKMQKALTVGGGTPPPLAQARSLCSYAHYFYRPP